MGAIENEVYPGAPVVLVALEVRHPVSGPLTDDQLRAMKRMLADQFPIERPGQALGAGAAALTLGAVVPGPPFGQYPRFMNRAQTAAVSFRAEAVVVETSEYPGWDAFRPLVASALSVRADVAPVDGVERVGLRYIDEIRLSGAGEPDWSRWVHASVLAPRLPSDLDMPVGQWQGVVVYGRQPGQALVFRYGPREGFAVDPSSDLRRPRQVDGGPYFLMDIDSYWTPDRVIPEYDAPEIAEIAEALHRPVRRAFEAMITDRLRDEVLRRRG